MDAFCGAFDVAAVWFAVVTDAHGDAAVPICAAEVVLGLGDHARAVPLHSGRTAPPVWLEMSAPHVAGAGFVELGLDGSYGNNTTKPTGSAARQCRGDTSLLEAS